MDLVVFSLVAEYLENLDPPFAEFARILRPGGTLVLSAHHPFSDWRWFGLADYYQRGSGVDHWDSIDQDIPYYRRTMEDLFGSLHHAGLAVTGYLEPRPDQSLRDRYPEQFTKESEDDHGPVFVFLRAAKP